MNRDIEEWRRRQERRERRYRITAWVLAIAISGIGWWLVFTIAAAVLHV